MNFNIITILDARIKFLSKFLEADEIGYASPEKSYIETFIEELRKSEYCFIIAPEFSNILYNLTETAYELNKIILSVNLEGIKLGTSKQLTYDYFIKRNISTPRTHKIPMRNGEIDFKFILRKFEQYKSPIIIKPDDGVGSEGIFYFNTKEQIKKIIDQEKDAIEQNRSYILQEFIEGSDLSFSLLGFYREKSHIIHDPILLGVNSQSVRIKDMSKESEYIGGNTPVQDYKRFHEDFLTLIERLNPPICGYFGIDFVRTANQKNYYIEINPRLTTSYLGVRNTLDINPAEMIYNAKINQTVLKTPKTIGHSSFSRIELQYNNENRDINPSDDVIPKLMELIPELVTPPIFIGELGHDNKRNYFCFISTKEKTKERSLERMQKIRDIFKKHNFLVFK